MQGPHTLQHTVQLSGFPRGVDVTQASYAASHRVVMQRFDGDILYLELWGSFFS